MEFLLLRILRAEYIVFLITTSMYNTDSFPCHIQSESRMQDHLRLMMLTSVYVSAENSFQPVLSAIN